MSGFITNLLLFSPLLVLAATILYLLDRRDTLRAGAGLAPPPTATPEPDPEPEPLPDLPDDAAPLFPADPPPDDAATDSDASDASNPAAAGPAHPRRAPRTRTVGPKKARSIARRDQRRAYFEFLHSQAQQRAAEAAASREADELRAHENALRRAYVEEEIAARKRAEREERERVEREGRERERRDVERVREWAREGGGEVAGIAGVVGRGVEWVEGVLRAEGWVGVGDGRVLRRGEVGVLARGWWRRVAGEELRGLWREVEEEGGMAWAEMGRRLEGIVG